MELQMPATPKGLSDEKAARIMVGLRGGQTPREFGVTPASLEAYLEVHPEYAREARPLIEANAKVAYLRRGANYRDKTHCKHGHPLSGDNLYLAPLRNERKCRTCVRLRQSAPKPPDRAQIERATAALIAGQTINQICWGKVGIKKVSKPILNFGKLKLHRRLNPDFDQFVLDMTKDNTSRGPILRRQRARTAAIRQERNDYHKIRAMLPANFPDRDDVVSDIFQALLSGSLQRDQVGARVQHYIAQHNRSFSTQYPKFGGQRLRSLDAPLFIEGAGTLGDRISRGLWD
jgi:hypothetical protein